MSSVILWRYSFTILFYFSALMECRRPMLTERRSKTRSKRLRRRLDRLRKLYHWLVGIHGNVRKTLYFIRKAEATRVCNTMRTGARAKFDCEPGSIR